jgi:hypothetical protein
MAFGSSVNITARCVRATISVARSIAAVIDVSLKLPRFLLAPAYAPHGGAARHAAYIAVASALPPPMR